MSRRLIFNRSSAVAVTHIAPAVVAAFVAAQASIAAVTPGQRVISLSDSSIAHNGAHRIKQAINYPSRAVASAIEEDFAAWKV
ncbi:hypothetical protein Q5691_18830 [Microcoleus sp. w1-18aA5]|uniref:hypothetical protein n=1 Tax=Microcoleus sp. w1-18aA5 TaxID=2818982 RepID=UPI002FCF78CF